ncbi:tRNA (cytidine(56)-2'-O)-methyltransferase [Infirmifilum sp. NZ]|uniref:tRNA (cytidine(56)-2'-O)-methyltransferase n=1 Tax=Infirmifilum sp. NZ TaxID=2926850 RepID=UPI00279CFC55|nr:tRNA (cytidine(56)-2'-O)-methyltransferase [Infirmifilum sp. NZ]UNQ72728.1 tRNA (cytidine(56)-2'-O)-methyltransferase [Infirmifilum sp. NZ]
MSTQDSNLEVYVLRIGHRPVRDHRVTTHVGLVARAFGARGLFLEERVEKSVIETLVRVCETWGGEFKVEIVSDPLRFIREWKRAGKVVHLTMYGLNIAEGNTIDLLRQSKDKLLVVVGGEKVPWEVYDLADFNLAIGNQPHSEVAALAVFLDRLFDGKELIRDFPGAKIKIIPSPKGKRVVKLKNSCRNSL